MGRGSLSGICCAAENLAGVKQGGKPHEAGPLLQTSRIFVFLTKRISFKW